MKIFTFSTILLFLFSFQLVAQEPPLSVTSFTLVNADTDEDLFELIDGIQIDMDKLPTLHLDIRANTTADVESVRLSIGSRSGDMNNTRTESRLPYAFFRDLPIGDYIGANFFSGDFSISATPYSQDNLGGLEGNPFELTFKLIDYCIDAIDRSNVFTTPADCNGEGGRAELVTILAISDEDAPYWEGVPGGYTYIGTIEPGTYQITLGHEHGCTTTIEYTIEIDSNDCPNPNDFSLRINAGGSEVDYNGETFIADSFFDTGRTLDRPQTGLPEPYQTFRYSRSQVMGYDIPVPDGQYTVRLHFAELYFGATGGGVPGAGRRVFDVSIEGQLKEDNLDIFAEVGAEAMLVREHTVTVTGGVLNIDFDSRDAVGGERHPVINAIEIATAEIPHEIWLEAECASIGGNWSVINDNISSNGQYLKSPVGGQNLEDPDETITFDVNVSEAGIYNLYALTRSPPGGYIRVSINGNWRYSAPNTPVFTWSQIFDTVSVSGNIPIELNAGLNTIQFGYPGQGISLDKIFVTKTDYVPSDLGGLDTKCNDNDDFALRINTGGIEAIYDGNAFMADSYYDTGRTLDRPQTGLPEPYQTFRYSRSQIMGYDIPVPDGEYTVRLHFAELYFGATGGGAGGVGKRVFDVTIEGQLVEDNLDVYAEVGAEAMLVKSHTITVTDGIMDIDFSSLDADGGERHPVINAIEINSAERPFITTWKTDNPGVSDDNEIVIMAHPGKTFNYDISWGDGTSNLGVTGSINHSYAEPGIYQVSISGDFPHPNFSTEFYNGEYFSDGDKILSIDQWGNIEWRSMSSAFSGCANIKLLATDAPNLSSVEDMSAMFTSSGVQDVDLNDWDTSNVKNMEFMFFGTSFNGGIENWNVSNVTDMSSMFEFNREFNQDIGGWDVSNVSNMNEMFNDAEAFNQDIGDWDVSKVNNMGEMFSGAENFNQNIGEWNVSNVTNMGWLFRGAVAFNQNIGDWDVSNVNNMDLMFSGAENFNQDIGGWDVSSVIDMSLMFSRATAFNQNIGNWNVGNVTKMSYMFDGANSFNQPIGNWNVGNVTAMDRMFLEATSFNQDIGNWDVSQVVEMRGMFGGAISFNQDIGNWNITNVNEMIGMFSNVSLSLDNYDSLLNGWSSQQVQRGVVFDGGNSQYCQSAQARHKLIEGFAWRIFDGGRTPDCTAPDVFVLRINTGGSALSFNFKDYVADIYFDAGSTLDRPQTGLVGHYRTFRYSRSQQMSYDIPVPDGEYTVRLHFAELWFGATGGGLSGAGRRVFDVQIEDRLAEDNLDIYAQVGAEAMLVKTHTVTVTDGVLSIDFDSRDVVGGERHPVINGIEILSVYNDDSGKLAFNKPISDNVMRIAPNPVIASTNLSFEKPVQLREIQVFDAMGRLVRSYKDIGISANSAYMINTGELPPGAYFINSYDVQGNRYQKQMVVTRQ